MDQTPEPQALPPSLRALKWLVIALTLTMILGVITVVAVLVTRIPQAFSRQAPSLPAALELPDGLVPGAVTFGPGWIAVVATDAAGDAGILVFSPDGTLLQRVPILSAGP